MRKKHLPFILTAAMCLSLGGTAIGSESSTELAVSVDNEAYGALDSGDPISDTGSQNTGGTGAADSAVTDPTDPGTTDPADPGTTDPADPGTTDPTDPGTTDPADPGTTDPTDPGTTDPTEPDTQAPTEPDTQAPTEPDTQAPTEPDTQAPTEPDTQAPTEPDTQAPTEPDTPAQTEPETQPPKKSETEKPSDTEIEEPIDTEAFQEEEVDVIMTDEVAEKVEEEKEEEAEDTEEEETETETETELAEEAMTTGLVSDGGLGELYIAVHGYPVGDLTKNEKDVYTYLRKELGLNKAAASGVLANVYFESNFSSVAVGDGGTSLGLCQWHLGRCKSLISWCGAHDLDYRSVEGQLGYLDYELNNIYKDVFGYLLGVPDSAEGAYRAGYYFCMYFESPSDTKTRSEARGTMAKNSYYPSDLDKFLEEEEEEQENKGVKLSDRARLFVKIDEEE